MNGILVVDKPEGITSAEVVRRAKSRTRVKVGHLGTLDPFATGVLPLCLGEATKIAQFVSAADKDYVGTIRLGTATNTGDRTGEVVRSAGVPPLSESDLSAVERRFTGEYRQTPPMFSALKRDGVPLYRLARKGVEVDREERVVQIRSLRLRAEGTDRLRFEVTSSKGTYIRVLAEDIGVALGTVAHLESLRRTRFGIFRLAEAVDLDAWAPERGGLVSIPDALAGLPSVVLDSAQAEAVRKGQARTLESVTRALPGNVAVLLDASRNVVAVVVREAGRWTFGRVLAGNESGDGSALQGGTRMLISRGHSGE